MSYNFDLATHILCIGSAEQVQGLQWALDRLSSKRSYKVYRGQIHDLETHGKNYDFIVMMLDLAQPVPLENLKRVADSLEGLCFFMQPTPGQLLALSEVSYWKACAWDGVSYEVVAHKTEESLFTNEKRIHEKAFLASTKNWLQKMSKGLGQLRLLNSPAHWSGYTFRTFNSSEATLSLGQLQSKSQWKLPIPGKNEICEFVFQSGHWQLKIMDADNVFIQGNKAQLKVGDQIQIGELKFLIEMTAEVEDIVKIANRLNVLEGEILSPELAKDLESFCVSLLYSQAQGELQIKSLHKRASIWFSSGAITGASAGAVQGIKALARIFLWDQVEWKFVAQSAHQNYANMFHLDLMKFTHLVEDSKKRYSQVEAFVPPPQVLLSVDAQAFKLKNSWTPLEAKVIGTVAEYSSVREVLNYCPLSDLDVYEALIALRKQGLIKPVKIAAKIKKEN